MLLASCLVAVTAFKIISLAERYSPRYLLLLLVLKIISVTDRPTSSCFAAGFQVISVAGRFANISVVDHLAPS